MNKPEMVFPIAHIHYDDETDGNGKVIVPEEVQDAIRTLIRWSGDDPTREGLIDTPARVGRAWRGRGRNIARATRKIRRITCRANLPKWAVTTNWCC